jgi:ubiquitin-protein ligase E3 C
MLPLFDDDRRRHINLGGASSASTHTAILDQAKARRTERLENKRRQENAVRLQARWRGLRDARLARREMRQAFENDLTGITGLRCLVLIGRDDDVLGKWSSTMVERGEGEMNQFFCEPN